MQIEWKTPAFDGKPPVPYGDKSFDEYGFADMDWWYPREIPGFGCPVGAPLADVITSFGVAKAQRGGTPIERALVLVQPGLLERPDGDVASRAFGLVTLFCPPSMDKRGGDRHHAGSSFWEVRAWCSDGAAERLFS